MAAAFPLEPTQWRRKLMPGLSKTKPTGNNWKLSEQRQEPRSFPHPLESFQNEYT